jgi:Flp pilus assembly protein TadD
MIAGLLIAAASAASAPTVSVPAASVPAVPTAAASNASATLLKDARQALAAGRVDQARLMTARAISEGARGADVDRVLADLAFADAKYDEALTRYKALLLASPEDPFLLERVGIAALRGGAVAQAVPLITRATKTGGASWRAWNALGVLADLSRDWGQADDAYALALRLAPNPAEVVNNRGWSQVLRGNWPEAVKDFELAATVNPSSTRISNNLELARAAMAADLPRRREKEADEAWAERLNDAGVAAAILGDKPRAIAAFTQALEASGRWYERAANNLEAASRQ